MVTKKFARRSRKVLQRVLENDNPRRADLITLFGGEQTYHRFIESKGETGSDRFNRMMEIAHWLTPDDWRDSEVRNYAYDTRQWLKRVFPKLRADYLSANQSSTI